MKHLLAITIAASLALTATARQFTLSSPSGRLSATVTTGSGATTFTLSSSRQPILAASAIGMTLQGREDWGTRMANARAIRAKVDATIASPLYRQATVADNYNALTLRAKGYDIEFRMYDDGLAYRFVGHVADSITVAGEQAHYRMAADHTAYVPYIINRSKKAGAPLAEQWWNDQQCQFTPQPISQANTANLMAMPFAVSLDHGESLCVVEADQRDYPGMYLLRDETQPLMLNGMFPQYPDRLERGGHGDVEMLVKTRRPYIARTSGSRTFPWRTFIVAENDGQLVTSDMVYRLAQPCRLSDVSWIKPGKCAWDWWNNSALYGVPFKAGFNNDTYRYFIDFAHDYGLEYVLIDEGWFSRKSTDIFDLAPDIDLKALVSYANERQVGLILWTGYLSLARCLDKAVKHYADMGIKGFKIDFLNRDDQPMLQFMQHTAELCAKHHMLVDFHGTGKPAGWQRTYPNVVNYEAVFGLEQMRWSPVTVDMVTHDVTLPFTRMVAGPMDYTPGAMRNSLKGMYSPNKRNPMSQGTRMHQVAMYVCYDSPLNMLSDSPSRYMADPVCTRFIASIPTTFARTQVLDGRIGQYLVTARQGTDGQHWYVGALNNWERRTVTVVLPEACRGRRATVMADGLNAERVPEDYQQHTITVPADGRIDISMAPGGGWALVM